MTSLEQDVVIVGGGVAAVRAAQGLRNLSHSGRITIVSEETETPYDRPPLSKDMLLGDNPREAVRLLPDDAAAELDIELLLGRRASGIDTVRKQLLTDSHDPIGYDSLIIATGTKARRLNFLSDLPGAHHLRTAEDARAIHKALVQRSSLTIVGAGFIGLEIASVAREQDCEVTIVELAERPLIGVLGETLASWLQAWHTERGVTFRCGVSVADASAESGRIEIELGDGSRLLSDAVVVGVGVHRELDWITSSGVTTHVGMVCDATGRTSTPGVFGAGDIVCVHDGGQCRPVQHWTAAVDSGERAARAVLGLEKEPSVSEGYFWSNQSGLRLMSVGHPTPDSRMEIVSGDLGADKFVAQWTAEDGRVVGVVGANSAKDFLRSRLEFRRGLDSLAAR